MEGYAVFLPAVYDWSRYCSIRLCLLLMWGMAMDGVTVGEKVGESDGDSVGETEGDFVGDTDGETVGDVVGGVVGESVGNFVGESEGEEVGLYVGLSVGDVVGDSDGGQTGSTQFTSPWWLQAPIVASNARPSLQASLLVTLPSLQT
mmetsp:Transcript_41603/g.88648  ORF Transcript_41603/g.88648 Transcript_41603/m.88648 type:complete len:147 (+) Transcript_41603:263-703(+)